LVRLATLAKVHARLARPRVCCGMGHLAPLGQLAIDELSPPVKVSMPTEPGDRKQAGRCMRSGSVATRRCSTRKRSFVHESDKESVDEEYHRRKRRVTTRDSPVESSPPVFAAGQQVRTRERSYEDIDRRGDLKHSIKGTMSKQSRKNREKSPGQGSTHHAWKIMSKVGKHRNRDVTITQVDFPVYRVTIREEVTACLTRPSLFSTAPSIQEVDDIFCSVLWR
ncbi:hypothetical protein CT0861_00350, partial [Colletotrichum tofieldiae]